MPLRLRPTLALSPPTHRLRADCEQLEADRGAVVCRENVRNSDRLDELNDNGVLYLVPVTGALPPVAIDSAEISLLDFLKAADPALANIDADDLEELVHGPEREYITGRLLAREDRVAFTVEDGHEAVASYELVDTARDALEDDLVHEDARFTLDIVFSPSDDQADVVRGWRPKLEVEGIPIDPDYVNYAAMEGVGTIRVLDRLTYEAGLETSQWGPADILVLEDAEQDLERPVAGVVSSEPLNSFGRLVQRSIHRGTPACYMKDAFTTLAAHDGELARLTCGDTGLTIGSATQAEADTFRAGLVGESIAVVEPDFTVVDLMPLLDLDTSLVGTYGLEATRMATAYQAMPGNLQLRGLAVPAAYYQDFLERNTWVIDLGDGPALHTYQETLDAWTVDPTFLNDASERRTRLTGLSNAMAGASVDPLLSERLDASLPLVFGSALTMVRVRPSVNLEEQNILPHANLYTSASACVADDLDSDPTGPSRCDATELLEKGLSQAVAQVYAGLWTMDAYEQRAYHGVDSSSISMSLVLTDRIAAELLDVVVRAPAAGGTGLVIAAQEGSGRAIGRANEYPTIVEITDRTRWLQPSSELDRGDLLLTPEDLEALESGTAEVANVFSGTVVAEWKLRGNGQWVMKYVQPVR